jgi:hypothetical protein
MEKREIWSTMQDLTQICFDRMDKKGIRKSWRWVTFPNTVIRIKITVEGPYTHSSAHDSSGRWSRTTVPSYYESSIKVDANQEEKFTSAQVEEFLVEKILLGDNIS